MLGIHSTQSMIPPADRQNLSHRTKVRYVELKDYGNPDCLREIYGKLTVMLADSQAGKCWRHKYRRKKRKPFCNGTDTGSNFTRSEKEQTSDGC